MDLPAPERPSGLERLIAHVWRWLAVMVATGWFLGAAAWTIAHLDQREYLVKNELPPEDRFAILKWSAWGVVLVMALYIAVWLWGRRADPDLSPWEAFARFTRRWFLALCTPLLLGLFAGELEHEHRVLALFFIMTVTVVVLWWVYLLPPPRPDPEPVPPPGKLWQDRSWHAALALVVAYGVGMTYLALVEHYNFGTHAYDLGIYDNIMWRTLEGDVLGCSLCKGSSHSSGHFDPILILLTPFYAAAPRAETLLIIQAWWLASAGIPLYLIARRTMPRPWFGVGLMAVFYLHPALHGINLFDFHSVALSVPLTIWAVYFIDTGRKWRYVAVMFLLLITREDMSLIACFIGLYAMLKGRTLTGVLTIVVALAWLVTVKNTFMPDPSLLMQQTKDSDSFIYYYDDMIPHRDEGMKGLIISFFSNPSFALRMLGLNEGKAWYFAALLLPFFCLPLFAKRKRILMVYGFVFVGLATRKHVYSVHFQYSAMILPFVAASLPEGVMRFSESRLGRSMFDSAAHLRKFVMVGMLTTVFLLSARFGAFVPNRSFKGGWNRLDRYLDEDQRERYRRVRHMLTQVPPDAKVSATSAEVPHVSNRETIYKYPRVKDAEYLLLRTDRMKKKKHKRRLKSIGRKFNIIGEYKGFRLYKRWAPLPGEAPRKDPAKTRRKDPKSKPRTDTKTRDPRSKRPDAKGKSAVVDPKAARIGRPESAAGAKDPTGGKSDGDTGAAEGFGYREHKQ